MKFFDLIVVGAGPAGATAARKAAEGGLQVLLLERKPLPRYKACGGGLPYHIHQLLDIDIAPSVQAVIHRAVFSYRHRFFYPIFPKTLKVEMVLRDEFDYFLVEKAEKAGAAVSEQTACQGLEEQKERVIVRTNRGDYQALFVLGADGAASLVARLSGLRRVWDYGSALSLELKLPQRMMEKVKDTIYFNVGDIPSGYAWIFPKREQVSAGVCTSLANYKNFKQEGERYLRSCPFLKEAQVLKEVGAPLPFFRKWQEVATSRVALVGDAAGFVDPLSGEGIHYAIESGLLAGSLLPQIIEAKQDFSLYAQEIERKLRQDLEKAKILASVFFAFPLYVFLIGMVNPFVHSIFVDLIQGKLRYSELFDKLDKSFWAKLFRATRKILFPKATAKYFFYKN